MLPNWDPARLDRKRPFVAAAVGGRKMGKSTMITHLLRLMSKSFDLVITFAGSAACSPELRTLMEQRWDPRFQFSEWNQPLMDRLMAQQERLKRAGVERHVCILVDDIILTGRDEDALAHACLRGRHFNLSIFCASVSYTTLPKRCRRSLDVLLLFSCPMSGDVQILCSEYAQKARLARFLLTQLPEWTCLVMETLTRRQALFHYRVDLGATTPQTTESPADAPVETEASPEISSESRTEHRLPDTSGHEGRTAAAESGALCIEERTI